MAYAGLARINWSWFAVDGAMDKAPLGGNRTGPCPIGRGETGTKKSLLIDLRGASLGLRAGGSNTNDFKLALATLKSVPVPRSMRTPTETSRQNLWADRVYDYGEVRRLTEEFGFTLHLPRCRQRARTKKSNARKQARRWMVERGHSWLNRVRQLLMCWKKREDSYVGRPHLSLCMST